MVAISKALSTKEIGKSLTIAANPITRVVLARFEPMTLPIAISTFPLNAADTEITSSGRDVPKLIIIIPMTHSLSPNFKAIEEALSMAKCDPSTTKKNPMKRKKMIRVHLNPFSALISSMLFSSKLWQSLSKKRIYAPINSKRRTASKELIIPSILINKKSIIGTNAHVVSLAKKSLSGVMFLVSRKIVPSTKVILKILLPMALAKAISGFPLKLAETLAAISGRLVPSAIMVAPITNSDMLKRSAILSL